MRRVKRFLGATAILACTWIVLIGGWISLTPRMDTVWYRFENGITGQSAMSVFVTSDGPFINISFSMHLGAIHPTKFTFIPDDCLESISVNGKDVPLEGRMAECGRPEGHRVNLSSFVRSGTNDFFVRVRDHGGMGGLTLRQSPTDPLGFTFMVLMLLSVAVYAWYIFIRDKKPVLDPILFLALCIGATIRFLYVLFTPHTIRGHDTDGHIEYIRFIAENGLALPDPAVGWQFYQPPLYYFLTGGLWKFGGLLGMDAARQLLLMQWFSFALSVLALVSVAWIASMLFRGLQHVWERFLFVLACGAFPGIVFHAARINNDVLVMFLTVLGFALLVAFFQRRQWSMALALFTTCGLLIITKTNGVLFVAAVFLSLVFVPKVSWKKKISLLLIGALTVVILGGWFHMIRTLSASNDSTARAVVGNIGNLTSALAVQNDWKSIAVFNPIAVMQFPYNNVWDDSARRQYFWEFFLRSSLFGEYDFGALIKPFASFLLFLWMMVGILAAAGMLFGKKLRGFQGIPMLLILLIPLTGHVLFKFKAPFATTQDFRYSAIIFLPFIFYALIAESLFKGNWKWCVRAVVLGASVTSLEFLLLLLHTSS